MNQERRARSKIGSGGKSVLFRQEGFKKGQTVGPQKSGFAKWTSTSDRTEHGAGEKGASTEGKNNAKKPTGFAEIQPGGTSLLESRELS